jgi:hypothetical protein
MSRSRFTIAFLIAVWLFTPDVLCLVVDASTTLDEHECCELMGGQCSKMPEPEFHECCLSVTRTDAEITAKVTDYPDLEATPLPFIAPDVDLRADRPLPGHWLRLESRILPSTISPHSFDILRI